MVRPERLNGAVPGGVVVFVFPLIEAVLRVLDSFIDLGLDAALSQDEEVLVWQ
jgi:hypothetical protein